MIAIVALSLLWFGTMMADTALTLHDLVDQWAG